MLVQVRRLRIKTKRFWNADKARCQPSMRLCIKRCYKKDCKRARKEFPLKFLESIFDLFVSNGATLLIYPRTLVGTATGHAAVKEHAGWATSDAAGSLD